MCLISACCGPGQGEIKTSSAAVRGVDLQDASQCFLEAMHEWKPDYKSLYSQDLNKMNLKQKICASWQHFDTSRSYCGSFETFAKIRKLKMNVATSIEKLKARDQTNTAEVSSVATSVPFHVRETVPCKKGKSERSFFLVLPFVLHPRPWAISILWSQGVRYLSDGRKRRGSR